MQQTVITMVYTSAPAFEYLANVPEKNAKNLTHPTLSECKDFNTLGDEWLIKYFALCFSAA